MIIHPQMRIVLDTNVIVSALLSPNGIPGKIFDAAVLRHVLICYDSRILHEYSLVLSRPKFAIDPARLKIILDFIQRDGFSVIPPVLPEDFIDKTDKKFHETAQFCHATLITGNRRHFPPEDSDIRTPTEFWTAYSHSLMRQTR